MSEEKNKSIKQSQTNSNQNNDKKVGIEGDRNINLQDISHRNVTISIKEGYQPTDKLDTSNPPSNKSEDKKD